MKEKYSLTFKDKINKFSTGAGIIKAILDDSK